MLFLSKGKRKVRELIYGTQAINEEFALYEKGAKEGAMIENFIASGGWDVIEERILGPMEEQAFKVFQKVDPVKHEDVITAQVQASIVDEIRNKVFSTVDEGRVYRDFINNQNNSTQEDE